MANKGITSAPAADADPFASYDTNVDLAAEGIWAGGFRDEIEMKIRSVTCDAAKKFQNAQQKRQRNMYAAGGGFLPPDVVRANNIDLAVKVLIVDWRRNREAAEAAEKAGKPFRPMPPCTEEARRAALSAPGRDSLLDDVFLVARGEDGYRTDATTETVEAIQGNSSPS